MAKRCFQSLIVIAFLLVMFKVSDVKEETVVAINTYSPFAGACEGIKLNDLPPIAITNDIPVVGASEEEDKIPEIEQSWLYLFYQNMGYSREKFYEDLDLLAAITMAEAGNQSDLGKRLVIDTVLNRCNSDCWRDDDTIWETIAHPGQYTTYINGAYTRVTVTEDIPILVEEEILNQTNSQVIYFKTNGYFSGVPQVTKEGDHYFSGESSRW